MNSSLQQRPLFGVADYVVFVSSLMICAGIGLYHALKGGGGRTTGDFLMGGRKLKVLPLTISLVVSVISAVTLLGLPAEMYTQGSQYIFNIGSGIGILLTTVIFVPLLHPLQLTSMFEYLEMRFESRAVRLVGSILEILALLLYGGTALFAPATALEGVTGIPTWVFALVLGGFVTFYTTLGGLVAVVWTDVVQAVIMLAGILAVLIRGGMAVGGIQDIWNINKQADRLHFYNFDPDPRTRHTFYGLTAGFAMGGLSFYGASQFTFQRFTATKSTRDAKMTVLLNLPIFYVFHLLLCACGLIIFAYYDKLGCDPIANGDIQSSNQLLPYFVLDVLGEYSPLPGLFIAALTSGALSTISSVLNSIAALIWEDLLKDRITVSQRVATRLAKTTVLICGILVICLSFLAANFGPHIFQVCFAFLGASGGPQLGLFLLGALVPWANWKGAIAGCITGIALTSWITIGAFITKPFTPPLPPASTEYCMMTNATQDNYSSLMTTTSTTTMMTMMMMTGGGDDMDNFTHSTEVLQYGGGLNELYRVSYTWYTSIGVAACMIVGMLVSAFTKSPQNVNPSLIVPWYANIRAFCNRRNEVKGEDELRATTSNIPLKCKDEESLVSLNAAEQTFLEKEKVLTTCMIHQPTSKEKQYCAEEEVSILNSGTKL